MHTYTYIPFCVYVCARMCLHSSDTFGESTSTKIKYQIYHMIIINNQMIQAVTLLPPGWRSPTTLERVTFSAELPGSLLYFHNEPLHLLDINRCTDTGVETRFTSLLRCKKFTSTPRFYSDVLRV